MGRIKKRTIFFGSLFVAWLIIIFSFSAMNANSSTDLTTVTINILTKIRENNALIDVIFNKLTENYALFYIVRKMAHMFVFCMLQIIVFIFLKTFKLSTIKSSLISMCIVFLYACTDEFHQLFVSGRSGQFSDVMIDTFGGFIGLSICLTFLALKQFIKKMISLLVNKFQEE